MMEQGKGSGRLKKKTDNSQMSESILRWRLGRHMMTVPHGAACISITIWRVAGAFALLDFENRE